jgi:hypothetical protein
MRFEHEEKEEVKGVVKKVTHWKRGLSIPSHYKDGGQHRSGKHDNSTSAGPKCPNLALLVFDSAKGRWES